MAAHTQALIGSLFTPASLTSFDSSVLVALSRTQNKLWQDAGKTVQATADADPVRVATCPFSGVDYVAPSGAARPLLKNTGAFWYLLYDGVDDVLTSARVLAQPRTLSASGLVATGGPSWTLFDGNTNESYGAKSGSGQLAQGAIYGGGAGFNTGATEADTANTIRLIGVFNGASSVIRLNGQEVTGTVGASSTTFLTVGCRGGIPSLNATRIYGFIAQAAGATPAERRALDAYLAALAP